MVRKFFDKKTGSRVKINEHLTEELHKSVIKKFKIRKDYWRFKGSIQEADLATTKSLFSRKQMLNIYYVSQMFSLNMHGLNL